MRILSILYPLLSAALFSSLAASDSQKPVMDNLGPGPAMPPETREPPPENPTGEVILTDVLGRDRTINVFSGFTRDIETVNQLLGDENANTTVLAPLNSAIMALPRKPWEDPEDYATWGRKAQGNDEDRAHRNLRRFVEAHIIPSSPWMEGEKVQTLAGNQIWWESKDGKNLIQPGNVEIKSVASKVANGAVWVLDSTLNYT